METVVLGHLGRYPEMRPEDVYKLLFHAAMGSAHAARDREWAEQWLRSEMAGMGQGPEEPLIDIVSPDGRIARVHLRPWRDRGLDASMLLEAFLETARRHDASPAVLELYMERALPAAMRALPGTASFFERMRKAGLPIVHHSEAFRSAYRPAYRVVDPGLLELS